MLKSTTGMADLIIFVGGKNLQLQTWRAGHLELFKDKTLQNTFKSTTLQNMAQGECFLSKSDLQFIFCLTLTWSQQSDYNQLITSQSTINMLKCQYCIQTRSWKNWLRREQDFHKQCKFSSTQTNFPNPWKPILFWILQALHSLCIHFLPHTGPTQSSTPVGLQNI